MPSPAELAAAKLYCTRRPLWCQLLIWLQMRFRICWRRQLSRLHDRRLLPLGRVVVCRPAGHKSIEQLVLS